MATLRTRAWRRAQDRRCKQKYYPKTKYPLFKPSTCYSEEYMQERKRSWKILSGRPSKLRRAKQLGLFWPYKEWINMTNDAQNLNILFVCSHNKWRSPTAEQVWRRTPGITARSAGVSRKSKRTISVAGIRWADMIFVMEEKHKQRLQATFRDEVRYKPLYVLDIPDEYKFMDDDLVDIIFEKTQPLIKAFQCGTK